MTARVDPAHGHRSVAGLALGVAALVSIGCGSNLQAGSRDGAPEAGTGQQPPDRADAAAADTRDAASADAPEIGQQPSDEEDAGPADAREAGPTDAAPDGAVCAELKQAYAAALATAQECTVGGSDACGFHVRAGFFCDCTTFVNGGTDALTAIADQYFAAGCQIECGGSCMLPQPLVCQSDTTSSTGGRCKPAALLSFSAADDRGTFFVPVGYEIDILLPSGYGYDVVLSSAAVGVIEVTIPAGVTNPGGAAHLYRLRALAAGQVVVEIPYVSSTSDISWPPFRITLEVNGS